MSNVEGDDFELFVEHSWPIPDDLRPTSNSGSTHEDGDHFTSHWQIESKSGYAEGVTFRREWLNKIQRAAKLRGRMPLGLHRTTIGDAFAVLKLEDFYGLIEELHDLREKESGSQEEA